MPFLLSLPHNATRTRECRILAVKGASVESVFNFRPLEVCGHKQSFKAVKVIGRSVNIYQQ